MRKFDTKVQHLKYKVLREVARQAWNDTLLENLLDIPDTDIGGDPQRRLEQREDIAAVRRAIAALSEEHREILVLRDMEGLSYEDIAEMLGMKTMARGVRLTPMKDGAVKIECDVVAKFGQSVFSLAKTVQDAVKSSVESVAGLSVAQVNVNICGIAMPKELKK